MTLDLPRAGRILRLHARHEASLGRDEALRQAGRCLMHGAPLASEYHHAVRRCLLVQLAGRAHGSPGTGALRKLTAADLRECAWRLGVDLAPPVAIAAHPYEMGPDGVYDMEDDR